MLRHKSRYRRDSVKPSSYASGSNAAMDPANRENSMGEVMIKCPDTGRDIPTGMIADRTSFSATPVFFARVLCPLCNAQHEWFAREAWVCEADPRASRALS
jgi:hypothetical protein